MNYWIIENFLKSLNTKFILKMVNKLDIEIKILFFK